MGARKTSSTWLRGDHTHIQGLLTRAEIFEIDLAFWFAKRVTPLALGLKIRRGPGPLATVAHGWVPGTETRECASFAAGSSGR